jgi:hypothetical protein
MQTALLVAHSLGFELRAAFELHGANKARAFQRAQVGTKARSSPQRKQIGRGHMSSATIVLNREQ